jgi:YggT family protein
MSGQIAALLIETVFGLFIYVVLLRFWMQALRASFRTPVGQFVVALTNWAVLPARRLVPSFWQYDLASFVVAWVAQIVKMIALYAAASGGAFVAPGAAMLVWALFELLRYSLHLLILVVIVQVLFSWFNPSSPLAYVFNGLAQPFYAFFRRFIPPIGSVDLSPLIVVVLAQIVLILLDNAPRALLMSGGGS